MLVCSAGIVLALTCATRILANDPPAKADKHGDDAKPTPAAAAKTAEDKHGDAKAAGHGDDASGKKAEAKDDHGHASPAAPAAASGHGAPGVDPGEALERLMAGNQRYATGYPAHPLQNLERVKEVAKGQHPFAIILSCSDSRVPPEIVFDQGIGDLFVVRVAGNTALEDGIGSLEYAVEHLGARLIVVLGHERCGAVSAAMSLQSKPGQEPGNLGVLMRAIYPALKSVSEGVSTQRCFSPKCKQGAVEEHAPDADFCRFCGSKLLEDKEYAKAMLTDAAVKSNVRLQVETLKRSHHVLAPLIASGQIRVVGGRYDLDSGKVAIF